MAKKATKAKTVKAKKPVKVAKKKQEKIAAEPKEEKIVVQEPIKDLGTNQGLRPAVLDIAKAGVEQQKAPKKPVRGMLIEDRIVITDDYEEALEHYDRGCFGVLSGVKKKQLELSLVEAMYLYERGKLVIFDTKNKELAFEEVLDYAKNQEKTFWTRWRVYRDFRTRGYILKSALKFGADFLIYRRGMKPGEDHAKWVLYCVSESDGETWRNFSAKMRVAHSTRKKLLIGCVDDWGDVTFWEIRWCKP